MPMSFVPIKITRFFGQMKQSPPWLATKPKNRIIFKAFALFWAEAFLHI